MIAKCHTPLWHREHRSGNPPLESTRAHCRPVDLHVDWDSDWWAMQPVDEAITFGRCAAHAGLWAPSDFIGPYAHQRPQKLIGSISIDPNEPDYLNELRRPVEAFNLRSVKLGPIWQNYDRADKRMQFTYV